MGKDIPPFPTILRVERPCKQGNYERITKAIILKFGTVIEVHPSPRINIFCDEII